MTRFTPSAAKVKQIIRKYWPSITQLEQFKDVKLQVSTLAFKRNRNLKSYLVSAKLQPLDLNNTQLERITELN